MDTLDLKNPTLYINRELSLLEFNRRVIEQAKDESLPLLERLRFLCIASTNLDEFFEIRVAGLKQQVKYNSTQTGPDNLSPAEVLARVSETAHQFVQEQYSVWNDLIIPALAKDKIRLLRRAQWKPLLGRWIHRYFKDEVLPVLSPIGLDPAHPFPKVLNKNLYFIISLEGKDAFGRDSGLAIVQAPRSLPRVVPIPAKYSEGNNDFVMLSSIIHAHVGDLFPGMSVTGCYQFKVTRDSDLLIDDEEIDDLLRALEGELPSRKFSDAVRLEVADNCPDNLSRFLLHKFELQQNDLYQVTGPVNLGRLLAICDLVDRPELKFVGFTPDIPKRLLKNTNIFDALHNGDILLHHPFQSFAPVIDFLRQAAADPNVLSIKQTLYRTGADSAVVEALKVAARAGKEVTVVIELRARFDEEANIELASELQQVGAHVVYGVVNYKTHAKMILVVRREGRALRRYVHLGTGNYHARTARLYTDYGLLTCDKAIGEDVNKLFHQLTGLGRAGKLKKLLQSPFTLHKGILSYIEKEISAAAAGKKAWIIAKMNALVDPEIIAALYKASQAGVKIDLIIRGICCLRPGVKGVSENISVRSIVGRFLEHTRVYYFHNGGGIGEELVFCSSADWMTRNLHYRVEVCFPVEEKRTSDNVIDQGLLSYLSDNTQAWLLQSDGSYKRSKPGTAKPRSAQQLLLEHYCGPA
ncbi:polyphosphate kinase 1 [Nitrosomonas sp. Is35]|uniref:polyphosphate kinase 1 n=1 Tax=unclassified Nitrosomonas TaxID=2609265 RepID=UPI00294B30D8|nr:MULTISPECIES: polyphosphate kinase 1 [unclassified Nitrosomonas]MDV6342296.1 polyphosphate kinase 1 [Nitrosomonas sp. Is24]MDV6348202.1 polyphosphate kinase 1 [Nitrosomonas sp. Is35]